MPCYTPLHGYRAKSNPKQIVFKVQEAYTDLRVSVPCGQCLGCRIEKSRQWAIRIMHETQNHEISSFVTLTYNDENLPVGETLVKKDVQKFFKRLRKYLEPQKIKYYVAGEYGETTRRPHYHAVIFGYWPTDSKLIRSVGEANLYTSPKLEKIWKKGFVSFGAVTFESACYTASYVTKKITGKPAKDYYQGREPEFALMSRRPPIGAEYYEKYKDEIWRGDSIIMRGQEMRPPMSYTRKLEKENEVLHKEIKVQRKKNFLLYGETDSERLAIAHKIAKDKHKLFRKKEM